MYLSYYKLNKKPFDISPNPEFLWLGEKHKEGLATLKYGILENKGFSFLAIKALNSNWPTKKVLISTLPPRSMLDSRRISSKSALDNRWDSSIIISTR